MDAHAQRSGVPRVLHRPVLFDSVTGFLRYASPAAPGGFGPSRSAAPTARTSRRRRRARRARRTTAARCCSTCRARAWTGPPPTPPAPRRSPTTSFRCSSRTSGSRDEPDAQLRPALGRAADARNRGSATDRVRRVPERPGVPVRRHDSRSVGHVPAAGRRGVGHQRGTASRSLRGSAGIYSARQNMLCQVGSVTTNGLQQQTLFSSTGSSRAFGAPTPAWPGVLTPCRVAAGAVPALSAACACSTRTTRTRASTRSTSATSSELAPDWPATSDFTWAKAAT